MSKPRLLPVKRFVDSRRPITYGIVQAGENDPTGVRYIRPVDMTEHDGVRDASQLLRTSPDIARAYKRSEVQAGDIVMSIGPSYGKTMLVDTALAGANLTQGTARVAVDHRHFAPYVRWALRSAIASASWDAAVGGATFRALNLEPLGETPIPVWPISTERAIADYLDRETARIDALIAAKRRMVGLLEERAVAFIEDSAIDAGWEWRVLRRSIRQIEQGWSPQCDARLPDEGEWGVLKVGCVNRGEFKPDEVKALPTDLAPRAEHLVRNGDLLMSRANTRDLVGSTAVVSGVHPRTLLCDKLYRIRLDERQVTPRFVSLWLQTRAVRSQLELEATGASDSMQNIGQDTARCVVMPLPSLEQQESFVIRCDRERAQIGRVIASIQQQMILLQERRQALITAAVTGQLDISEVA